MNIKVCGMKYPDNIKELIQLPIDMIGFIFYNGSPRYIGEIDPNTWPLFPENIKRVGVFVNESIENICKTITSYQLNMLQLHGNESPEECRILKNSGMEIIKTFHIENPEDFASCLLYDDCCDFFLFDTKSIAYGGTGEKFEWSILSYYKGTTPFLLSGGISAEDVHSIKAINHPLLYGVDLNSWFELSPGLKNVNQLNNFITNL